MDETAEKPSILVVDDDALIRKLIRRVLDSHYQIVEAADGEEGLAIARQSLPAAVIADVQMPKLDGFSLCKSIADDFELADTPVMLMSAVENMDELLNVYDVGGQGFITKPINPKLLLTRIARMLQLRHEREQLKSQIQFATSTAFTAMNSMGETGVVLQTIQKFTHCQSAHQLAVELLTALKQFDLTGVAEVLVGNSVATLSHKGAASDVECAVIQKMADMERVVQFKTRLSVNFPAIKLLVNNMPVDDLERCGRLRDHLAILAESAESHVAAIRANNVISGFQTNLATALIDIDEQQRLSKQKRAILFGDSMMQLEQSFNALGLTDQQEDNLINIVRETWNAMSATYDEDAALQDKLTQIVKTLKTQLD
ncbi:response regulator [Chitinibacter fontanus]|uniref:Response regulator n=1 Tax=Chitinibacter fontanus TaxID=1737446 RepID=A0A7D5ZHA4_9NEIS|nr:response regulator [Chitinibacter fontanus]QLI80570.1 response regulator [Chitinibacter fontanus]